MSKKPILNFPGYEITKDGRIWSNKTNKWLRQATNPRGYPYVGLSKAGKVHARHVHRLVLETFVGLRPKGMECCHNNGDRLDNNLTNLRWDTRSENMKDAFQHGTKNQKGENNSGAKLNRWQVRIIKQLLKFPKEFTQKEIGKIFSVNHNCICGIKGGQNWKAV